MIIGVFAESKISPDKAADPTKHLLVPNICQIHSWLIKVLEISEITDAFWIHIELNWQKMGNILIKRRLF